MNTTDKIYYLKDDELFFIEDGSLRSASPEEIISSTDKTSLFIDDNYFFYVGMEHVSVSGKKLHSVANNYLSLLFPSDMIKKFGVYQGKGFTVIFIISEKLSDYINNYPELFSSVKKITTPFIELASRYDDFVFSDGVRIYKKCGNTVIAAPENEKGISAADLFSEMSALTTSIQIPGISKSRFSKTPYIMPGILVGICYIIFLIGQIISLNTISKTEAYYQETLQNVYKSVGLDKSNDPYGMLLYKANQTNKKNQGKRILTIISDLKTVADSNTKFFTLSIRDTSVRVDGITTDFAQAEILKKTTEERFKTSVSVDDIKKTDKGVTFVMRYEQ